MNTLLSILRSAIVIITPLLFASAGGLFPALAGTLNIALEGLLLIGAFSSMAAFYYTGSFTAALMAAVIASIALSALIAFVTLVLRSNVFIVGLAANLLAAGLCAVLSDKMFGTRGVIAPETGFSLPAAFPMIRDIPLIGNLFSGQSWYLYCSWLFLLLCWLLLYKTPFGFRLRACEKRETALVSLGLNPGFYRFEAFLISGLLCGIGGSFLSMNLGAFVPGMSAGKGWIALVIIFLGSRKPGGLIAAAFVFALADAFSNYLQGLWSIPVDFILAFPYICTLLAMIVVSIHVKKKQAL